MTAEARFAQMNLELPPAPQAIGLYRPLVREGNLAYLSGHLPLLPDGSLITGRVGDDLDTEQGYRAAQQTGLAVLATLKAHCGSLDNVQRLVKTVGLVRCTPEFVDQPAVINGFSELMRDVFGEDQGIAARSAIGVSALPAGVAVEIEAIFEIVSSKQ